MHNKQGIYLINLIFLLYKLKISNLQSVCEYKLIMENVLIIMSYEL